MSTHDDLKDTTQIRIIRSVVQDELKLERVEVLGAVEKVGAGIRREMKDHFAKQADLSNWVLRVHKDTDDKVRDLIDDHVRKDHKASLMPKARLSKGQVGALVGFAVSVLSAIGYLLKEWIQKQ